MLAVNFPDTDAAEDAEDLPLALAVWLKDPMWPDFVLIESRVIDWNLCRDEA